MTSQRVYVRRDANVRDASGNAYGILDVNPDPTDPAVLLGVLLAANGARMSRVVRTGDTVHWPGLTLSVDELSTADRAYVALTATGFDAEEDT